MWTTLFPTAVLRSDHFGKPIACELVTQIAIAKGRPSLVAWVNNFIYFLHFFLFYSFFHCGARFPSWRTCDEATPSQNIIEHMAHHILASETKGHQEVLHVITSATESSIAVECSGLFISAIMIRSGGFEFRKVASSAWKPNGDAAIFKLTLNLHHWLP